jgi:hypothetical protein
MPMPTRIVSFAKFYFCQVGLPNCLRSIFLVLPKLDGWQTAGDALNE